VGDHKGHVIAHSMGGSMDMNIINQAASVNLGKQWRAIETLAAENPGTAVAIHLTYDDDSSDRPAGFEYGYDDPSSGFQVEQFDNPKV
jgi:DNA/RNA non-specific endonuclease